jgi:hypothetical protein
MKTKKHNNEVEATMALLDVQEEPQVPPFFAQRVMNKIEYGASSQNTLKIPFLLRPAFIALFVAFNVASLIYATTTPVTSHSSAMELLAEQYDTDIAWVD